MSVVDFSRYAKSWPHWKSQLSELDWIPNPLYCAGARKLRCVASSRGVGAGQGSASQPVSPCRDNPKENV
eukprot:363511-Chlamydomonas_euryale.AAC.4